MHLSPAIHSKVVVLLLLIHCFLCFVLRYFVSILVLQSSRWGRESWLLCFVCLPGVSWLFCGSSSQCHRFVCSLWLWYFLIILTTILVGLLKSWLHNYQQSMIAFTYSILPGLYASVYIQYLNIQISIYVPKYIIGEFTTIASQKLSRKCHTTTNSNNYYLSCNNFWSFLSGYRCKTISCGNINQMQKIRIWQWYSLKQGACQWQH